MSRIDITVRDGATGALIANRGFCRDTHLASFCEHVPDDRVQELARRLFVGVSLTKETLGPFLAELAHTRATLQALTANEHDAEATLETFLSDLTDSLAFLQRLAEQRDLDQLIVDIA